MALQPVGPLPSSTYWVRRGVLAVGVLLVLLLVRSCAGGGDPSPSARTTALPTTRPKVTTPASTAPASTRPTPSRVASPTPSASPGRVAACRDADLSLVAATDSPSYAVGASPVLSLLVRNTGTTPCRRDLGSGAVELRVYSGADRIWSSDDCGAARGSDPRTLAVGASRSVRLSWSGRRSRQGCTGPRTLAVAGTYQLRARVGGLSRDGATFTFR